MLCDEILELIYRASGGTNDRHVTLATVFVPLLRDGWSLTKIEETIRLLEVCGYVKRVKHEYRNTEFQHAFPFSHNIADIASFLSFPFENYEMIALTTNDPFHRVDSRFLDIFYSHENNYSGFTVHPHSVFVAYQFDYDGDMMFNTLRQRLEEKGFIVNEGKADGLEEFRDAIINKIEESRFFICLLTRRKQLQSGGFASGVWLYQEIGAALALKKQPLVLVEQDIDEDYVGKFEATYERLPLVRHDPNLMFGHVLDRLNAELIANKLPLPRPPQ